MVEGFSTARAEVMNDIIIYFEQEYAKRYSKRFDDNTKRSIEKNIVKNEGFIAALQLSEMLLVIQKNDYLKSHEDIDVLFSCVLTSRSYFNYNETLSHFNYIYNENRQKFFGGDIAFVNRTMDKLFFMFFADTELSLPGLFARDDCGEIRLNPGEEMKMFLVISGMLSKVARIVHYAFDEKLSHIEVNSMIQSMIHGEFEEILEKWRKKEGAWFMVGQ